MSIKYDDILYSLELTFDELDASRDAKEDDEQSYIISMFRARVDARYAVWKTQNIDNCIRDLQNRLDLIKKRAALTQKFVDKYTNGRTKENAEIVCNSIDIPKLVKTQIIDDILTPEEIVYVVNKKITKKMVIKSFDFYDIKYILNSLNGVEDQLDDKKKYMLCNRLADLFVESEKSKYDDSYGFNIKTEIKLAKNELNVCCMPEEIIQDVCNRLNAYVILNDIKQND